MGATVALGFALTRFEGASGAGGRRSGRGSRCRNCGPNLALARRGRGPPPDTGAAGQRRPDLVSQTRPARRRPGGATSDADGARTIVRSASCCAISPATPRAWSARSCAGEDRGARQAASDRSPPRRSSWWGAARVGRADRAARRAVYGLTRAGLEPWLAALIVGGVVVDRFRTGAQRPERACRARLAPERTAGERFARTSILVRGTCLDQRMDRYRGDRARARRYAVSPGCHDRGAAAEAGARNDGRSGGTYFKEGGGVELGRNLGRSLRDNPIPVALIGVGIGWLVWSNRRRRRSDDADSQDRGWHAVDGSLRGRTADPYGRRMPSRRRLRAGVSRHQPMPYEAAAL